MERNASSALDEFIIATGQSTHQPSGSQKPITSSDIYETARDSFQVHCTTFNSVSQILFFYVTVQGYVFRVVRKDPKVNDKNNFYMTLHVVDSNNVMLTFDVPRRFHISISSER